MFGNYPADPTKRTTYAILRRDTEARLRPDRHSSGRISLQHSSPRIPALLKYRRFFLSLEAVGCRLLGIPRKLLIPTFFPHSLLSSFFPPLAYPPAKSFPCVSYKNIEGWGSGPTKFLRPSSLRSLSALSALLL